MAKKPSDYNVTGSVLQSKLASLDSLFGEQAGQIIARRQRIRLPIGPLDWFAYDTLVELLKEISTSHFRGRPARLAELGIESARQLLASAYRPLTSTGSWKTFLVNASRLHSQYYDLGTMNVQFEGEQCTVELSGAPRYALEDLHVMGGFYIGAAAGLDGGDRHYEVEVGSGCALFRIR